MPYESPKSFTPLTVPRSTFSTPAARDRMVVGVLLGCGIRIGSALGLDVADVDLAHGEIALRTTKGNRPTSVLVPKDLAKKLARFLRGRGDGPVFLAGGRRFSTRHAQRRLGSWFAKAGIAGTAIYASVADAALRSALGA